MCHTAFLHRFCATVCAVWRREYLPEAVMPLWERLYNVEPEGAPFRLPVEPQLLGIPVSHGLQDCLHLKCSVIPSKGILLRVFRVFMIMENLILKIIYYWKIELL